jgi:hypothetical protein
VCSGEYVSEKDLDLLVGGLEDEASEVRDGAGWAEVEDDVWKLYVKVEMMVTSMKLRLGVEKPGEFISVVEKEPITEHIIVALGSVTRARKSVEARDHLKALERLRGCRNDLRAFLDASRKLRLKQARARAVNKATRSSLSSSSS